MQTGRKATRQRSDLARSKTDVICRGLPREAQVVNAHSLPDSPTARQPDSPTPQESLSRSAVQPPSRLTEEAGSLVSKPNPMAPDPESERP